MTSADITRLQTLGLHRLPPGLRDETMAEHVAAMRRAAQEPEKTK